MLLKRMKLCSYMLHTTAQSRAALTILHDWPENELPGDLQAKLGTTPLSCNSEDGIPRRTFLFNGVGSVTGVLFYANVVAVGHCEHSTHVFILTKLCEILVRRH